MHLPDVAGIQHTTLLRIDQPPALFADPPADEFPQTAFAARPDIRPSGRHGVPAFENRLAPLRLPRGDQPVMGGAPFRLQAAERLLDVRPGDRGERRQIVAAVKRQHVQVAQAVGEIAQRTQILA